MSREFCFRFSPHLLILTPKSTGRQTNLKKSDWIDLIGPSRFNPIRASSIRSNPPTHASKFVIIHCKLSWWITFFFRQLDTSKLLHKHHYLQSVFKKKALIWRHRFSTGIYILRIWRISDTSIYSLLTLKNVSLCYY